MSDDSDDPEYLPETGRKGRKGRKRKQPPVPGEANHRKKAKITQQIDIGKCLILFIIQ
jgi:hypothetical protein